MAGALMRVARAILSAGLSLIISFSLQTDFQVCTSRTALLV